MAKILHEIKMHAVIWHRTPKRRIHLVMVEGLVRLCDPESNAGGSLTTSRATQAGKVKG
jgi:hypothetical protein